MNFFEMLLISRKMAFGDGKVSLYNQNVFIFPTPSIVEYIARMNNSPEFARDMYHAAKEAMLEHAEDLSKAYDPSDGVEWICDYINLYGQGKVKYENSAIAPMGVILLENSPLQASLNGRVRGPVDHALRGIISGLISSVLKRNVDVIEMECAPGGKGLCRLIVDLKQNLKRRFPDLYSEQIG